MRIGGIGQKPLAKCRVAAIVGRFDLQSTTIEERFTGAIEPKNDWQVGLIVGKSGTGKTSIARQLFPESIVIGYEWGENAVVDDMPKSKSIDEITGAFMSVGFSSPPSWLKPYSVLSNGEKMRCDLARAILEDSEMFVFDEFTSVVDRQVAQVASYAMQKAIRKTQNRFIAVTCHADVEDWLLPDWVFSTDDMTFRESDGQKKNRPEIRIQIFDTKDREVWKLFARHHYLAHNHNTAARIFVIFADGQLCGMLSTLNFPNQWRMIRKAHRLVILPDYQGIGLAMILNEFVAKDCETNKITYMITTSHPSLIAAMRKSEKWKMIRNGRVAKHSNKTLSHGSKMAQSGSSGRITATFEWKKTNE